MTGFVHLRVHSDYSMVDGLIRAKELPDVAKRHDMAAVALTDDSNLCGAITFYKSALSQGVKPIVGCDVWVRDLDFSDTPFRILLLAQNLEGYRRLTRLVSRAYTQGQKDGRAIIDISWFGEETTGLIALSGGRLGDIGQSLLAGKHELAAQRLGRWKHLFPGRFYLELIRTGRPDEEHYIHQVMPLAEGSQTPVVATNDVCFVNMDDFEAHEARVCIHQGRILADPKRPRNYSPHQFFKSAEEMSAIFRDIPEALENTVEIAKRCNIEIPLGKYFLPEFPIPEGDTLETYFRKVAQEGLERRLRQLFDPNSPDFEDKRKPYDARLKTEIDIIIQMGFPGYFLIVADFIQWAKNNGIPVGPGRGSGAGSLVAYALQITELDPLAYDLLFERFLNPERVSMPDFDVDFCMEGRDRVIEYVAEKYGRDAVSQIITFGTMAAKAVVRDVGRVLGKPYGMCDRLSKMIPNDVGITLEAAFNSEENIQKAYQEDEEIREIWDLAVKLEGIIRGHGKHAGGVVIAPGKLTDYVPVLCDEDGQNLVTQYDKDDVEAAGLVKFDFLGLRTLTIINWTVQTINRMRAEAGQPPIDINQIDLNDQRAYTLMQKGDTTAVFQLESVGMKKLIRQLKPSTFEDIVALVALFRPGPLGSGMHIDFVNRKHGREKVQYPHPMLESILRPTYGTILYQEQVMQIAQVMAGYSLGGADLLRRAMGKKKKEVMDEQRAIFVQGAMKNGIDEAKANAIFDLMQEFAKYGFNKSHSAAYALVSFQTAWLKAHYPAAFLAAVMSSEMDNTDKVVIYVDDARSRGLKVLPPDINRGQYHFSVKDEATIVYGLGAIKGVGQAAIEAIIAERTANGPYRDLYDFCARVDLRKVNRRTLEALIKSGALDCLGHHRAELMANLDEATKAAEQKERDLALGQTDLFGGPLPTEAQVANRMKKVKQWPEKYRLAMEKETLGLYLTGHPYTRFEKELAPMITCRLRDLAPTRKNETVTVAGLVMAVTVRRNKDSGESFAIVTIDDKTGRLEIMVGRNLHDEYANFLVKDKVIIASGSVRPDRQETDRLVLHVQTLWNLETFRSERMKYIALDIDTVRITSDLQKTLKQQLMPFRGGRTPICLTIRTELAEAVIDFGDNWRVTPSDELLTRLEDLLGKNNVHCVYS